MHSLRRVITHSLPIFFSAAAERDRAIIVKYNEQDNETI